MKTITLTSKHIDPKELATALANAAQDSEPYQFMGIVAGKPIHLKGTKYHLELFLIDGAGYQKQPGEINTRSAFKAYIINSIVGA